MTNPFAAAINLLRLFTGKDWRENRSDEFVDSVLAAIRVLEAARRVDKERALVGMEALRAAMSREMMDAGLTWQGVNAILEALPAPAQAMKEE